MEVEKNKLYRADSNENLFGTSPKVIAALQKALDGFHSYPLPDAAPLRHAIAQKLGLQPANIVTGSGSAELISLLVRACCKPYHLSSVLSVTPSYPLYQQEAEAVGTNFKAVPLNSAYQLDVESLLAQVEDSTRLCFLSNPNNPTGSYLRKPDLERLIRELPPRVTLVIDEAYLEYVNAPDFADATNYLDQRHNLVILRTFSKAYGLASLRVGYMVARETTLAPVLRIKQPFNVNNPAQLAAQAALHDKEFLDYTLQQTAAGKQQLQQALTQLGVQHWPSEGNFLLLDAGLPAQPVYRKLQQQHIHVRLTDDRFALRITIGRPEYQEQLIQTLSNMLEPEALTADPILAQVLKTGEAFLLPGTSKALAGVDALSEKAKGNGNASERTALAFARAFAARMQHATTNAGNLYSSTFGLMDMISAFNVLVKETPLVTFGHVFANLSIAEAVAAEPEIHLLDLGIGSGLQWMHLLDLLAARAGGAPRVHLTGIDLPAAIGEPDERLQETGSRLAQYAQKLGISFTYTGIASKLEEVNLPELKRSATEAVVVNAALALHHIADMLVSQTDERDKILKQVLALQPRVFTLTEPDSEHNKLEFMPRLRESLRHYHTVFDVLDTLLPKQMPERQIIEQEFFGREIINVISCEGSARVERHERNQAWQHRLTRLGFAPLQQPETAEAIRSLLQLHPQFDLEPNGAGYTLHWKKTPVIAATAWVPQKSEKSA
ncbi:histidinol-phosphate transaminase [Botryobacter ruber]|uniref:histidinol-phosphate transaminase n=1 Tax=Botryobacter ruber TaxID=2171629 RepID=UPI000E0A7383|nr:histidinol-phosphate transaminase [Botryobacter ruber]